MPRLTESERVSTHENFSNHWKQAEAHAGKTVEIEPGYSAKDFQAQADAYDAKSKAIRLLVENKLPQLRVERDTLFGTSSADEQGVWFYLARYKPIAQGLLGGKHPLSRTIPNLGKVHPSRMLSILESFIEHWALINQARQQDMTIGGFDLATLKKRYTALETLLKAISKAESIELPLLRAEREQLYGDLPEEQREQTSLISRMLLYRNTIEAFYPNDPISQSLPRIFPQSTSESIATFAYNWVALENARLQTWFTYPQLEGAAQLYLQEGVVEKTEVLAEKESGSMVRSHWDNIQIVGELDLLELRDADGRTLMRGVRDSALPQPSGE